MSYSYDDFSACLEQTFLLDQGDRQDSLMLVQVEKLDRSATVGEHGAFSVVFQSSRQDVMPQQIYHLSNQQLGELQIFIVPIGQDESGVRYEAVFS